MSNKTVTIDPKPRRKLETDPAILDALVQGKTAQAPLVPIPQPVREEGEGKAPADKTPMKRLTFDIKADLHKRIRRTCLEKDVDMAAEIRRVLEREFPA
jgi:hypothetical protein